MSAQDLPLVLPRDGSEANEGDPRPVPCSPFDVDGLCRHCRGQGEHFASCIYAREWEKFGGGL